MVNNQKRTRLLGVLFLLPLLAYGLGDSLLRGVLDAPDFLATVAGRRAEVVAGALLLLLNSVTVVGIGVVLFPLLVRLNERIALVYLSARLLEAVILTVGTVGLLAVLAPGEQHLKAGSPDAAAFQPLLGLVRSLNFWAYQTAMLLLGLGSLGFCYLLYRAKLVPPFLSLPGLAGYGLLAVGSLLEMAGFGLGVLFSLPGGLFEVGFGVWLLGRNLGWEPTPRVPEPHRSPYGTAVSHPD